MVDPQACSIYGCTQSMCYMTPLPGMAEEDGAPSSSAIPLAEWIEQAAAFTGSTKHSAVIRTSNAGTSPWDTAPRSASSSVMLQIHWVSSLLLCFKNAVMHEQIGHNCFVHVTV